MAKLFQHGQTISTLLVTGYYNMDNLLYHGQTIEAWCDKSMMDERSINCG
jgi:hypothetical protein